MTTGNFEYVHNVSREKVVGNEGLKAYTRKVFNYMMASLGLTAVISYLILRTGLINLFLKVDGNVVGYSGLGMLTVWSPLFIILYMSFNKNLSAKGSKIGLFTVAGLEGASLSLLLLYAGVHNAFQAFLITGVLFGSMSLYGYITKRDLLQMGSFLIMGVWGLILVSIIGMFTGGVGIWASYLTVILFTGLVAYETQQIKYIYSNLGGYGETSDKLAVFCALNLYLSFLNIFTAILNILGSSRD